MFNAWRKAWAKDKEGSLDDGSSGGVSISANIPPRADHAVRDRPETSGDGAAQTPASVALDYVPEADLPKRTLPPKSSRAAAVFEPSDNAALASSSTSHKSSPPRGTSLESNYRAVDASVPPPQDEPLPSTMKPITKIDEAEAGPAAATDTRIPSSPAASVPPPAKRRKLETTSSADDVVVPKDEAALMFKAATSANSIVSFSSRFFEHKFLELLLAWSHREQRESDLFEPEMNRKLTVIVAEDEPRARELYDNSKKLSTIELACVSSSVLEVEDSLELDLPDLAVTDAVVFTAQLFLHALAKSTLSISMINLLILDGADKAHHNHRYAHLMLDYYHTCPQIDRPRFVGIMDPATPITSDILFVENTCNATLVDLSIEKRAMLGSQIYQPEEIVTFYEPPIVKRDTTLCAQLKAIDPDSKVLKAQLAATTAILRDVGPCAADLVWRRFLISLEPEFRAGEPEPTGDDAADEIASDNFRIKMKIRTLLKEWAFTMPNLNPSSKTFNVSPKFAKLIQVLQCFEQQGEEFRGLVLVQKRSTAAAVADMLRTIGDQLPFLRPQTLVGQEARADILSGMDRSAQRDVVEEFRTGKVNLLVATRVAEDGVELPPCTCVIRFDMFENHISYAQSRARVDQDHGHFILMVEQGNDAHRRIVYGVARLDPAMQNWVHAVANTPGGVIPPPSLLEKAHADRMESDDEDAPVEPYILDPTTGGRIYAKDAAGVIYKYVAAHSEKRSSKPLFEHTSVEGGLFQCSVILPKQAPLSSVTSPPAKSKNEARRLACYQTCQQLFQMGFLDHTLFPRPPTTRSFLPDIYADFNVEPDWQARGKGPKVPNPLANVTLDANGELIKGKTAGTRCYARKRPAFWKNSLLLGFDGQLFPTIINLDLYEIHEDRFRWLCILTRHPLPPIEPIRIFHSGFGIETTLLRCNPISVTQEELEELHAYTTRVVRTVAGKALENALEKTPYFLAPMQVAWLPGIDAVELTFGRPSVREGIAWDEVRAGAKHWYRPMNASSLEELELDIEDAVVQDKKLEFARRFDARYLRRDLSPLSKPEGITGAHPSTPLSKKDMPYQTYLELCKARRKDFDGLADEHQPMIEVTAVGEVLNRLNPAADLSYAGRRSPSQYLIPELTIRHILPASVLRSALIFPSIIRRIDDYLLVKELNAKLFDNWLQEKAVLVALTAPSATVEFDYERQELLGDAYLKYLSSIYLFVTYPTQQEGAMHVARQRIISNRSLLQRAREADVPQYIQSKQFAPKMWIPYNFKMAKRAPVVPAEDESRSSDTSAPMVRKRSADAMTLEEGEVPENEEQHDMEEQPEPADAATESSGDREQTRSGGRGHSKPKRRWEDTRVQWLGDKCVADVAEALIGAAVITGGIESALKISKDLGCYLPRVDRWSDFGRKVLAPPPEWTAELSSESLNEIEEILGCPITKPHIMAQALTHTSILGNELPCYERLEFLGDAVLDYLVVGHIFDLYGALSPGALTLLKGAMVTNSALAAVCIETGLYKHVIYESPQLGDEIDEYARQVARARDLEYKVADNEGRPPGQYWVDIESPKPLSDIIESTLGALLVLDNFSSGNTQRTYDKVLKPFFEKHISLKTLAHHPTKVLFEMFQGRGCQHFEITEGGAVREDIDGKPLAEGEVRCDVICHEVILASAVDTTLPLATRRCCYMALDALEGDTDFLPQHCNCRALLQADRERRRAEQALAKAAASAGGTPASGSGSGDPDVDADGDASDYVDMDVDSDEADADEVAVRVQEGGEGDESPIVDLFPPSLAGAGLSK